MENNKYESVLTCGYCKRQTQVSDKLTEDIMSEKIDLKSLCSCGHRSYSSSMRSKFKVDTSDWRFAYGSTKEK